MLPLSHLRAAVMAAIPVLLLIGCAQTRPQQPAPRPARPSLQLPTQVDKPVDYPGLHNVVDYADGVYSGSAPDDDDGFASLAALGIKTVLSVDGMLPDVDAARAHGLHYVHLPIGYDGVPAPRGKQIAAVIEQLPKPIYIHCHHGKHRSAGAAATGCVIAGLMTPAAALARMHVSGTAADYQGLFASAREARPLPASELPANAADFPASSKTSGMVAIMVDVDGDFDDLKAVRAEQWQVPRSHPDLVPARAAQQLHDLLSGLANDPDTQQRPADFHHHLQSSIAAAKALQQALERSDREQCETQFAALSQSCKQCHSQYRNRH